MRTVAYIGGSTALALAIFIAAFEQHPTFYSAVVYLSQSNFCLMILLNFAFVCYASIMNLLRRICFGTLRPAEFEQLTDRAWIVTTETLLAMTVFREEIGAYFLMMFTCLITGKIWAWIAEGRLETLEQQPPQNPRLFHIRLISSLAISLAYDVCMLWYSFETAVQQSRPTMMMMYVFEFAVLGIATQNTIFRYACHGYEVYVNKKELRVRLAQRREETREEAARILKAREEDPESDLAKREVPDPEDIEEMDIEVAGWEAKGQVLLISDLIADLFKFVLYIVFFTVIFATYGLPVHILRDIYMTGSSFFRKVALLLKYRRAIQNISQYQDATVADIEREDTCIICRDSMRAWNPDAPRSVERTRPKKLPCGHILHQGCLKNWLERQQVCPTCRRPVSNTPPNDGTANDAANNNNNNRAAAPDAAPGIAAAPAAAAADLPADWNAFGARPAPGNNVAAGGGAEQARDGIREYQFGPLRLRVQVRHFGAVDAVQQANAHQQGPNPQPAAPRAPTAPATNGGPTFEEAQNLLAHLRERNGGIQVPHTPTPTTPTVLQDSDGQPGSSTGGETAQAMLSRLRLAQGTTVSQTNPSTYTSQPMNSQDTTSFAPTPNQSSATSTPAVPHVTPSMANYRGFQNHMAQHNVASLLPDLNTLRAQIRQNTEALNAHYAQLQILQQEINMNNMLVAEISRLQGQVPTTPTASTGPTSAPTSAPNSGPSLTPSSFAGAAASPFTNLPSGTSSVGLSRQGSANPLRPSIPAGSAELPPGVVLPAGWSFTPVNKPDIVPTPTSNHFLPQTSVSAASSIRSVSRSRSPVRSRAMLAALHRSASSSSLNGGGSTDVPVVAPSPLSTTTRSSLLKNESGQEETKDVKGKGAAVTVSDAEDEDA